MGEMSADVVVAVDGGGSKTDAVALDLDGTLIARATGPGSSPHFIGVESSVSQIDVLVREVVGSSRVVQANVYLSGLDLDSEVEIFSEAVSHLDWTSAATIVDNDLFALLRVGTSARDAVAVICGTGINALGTRADGATARFAALGDISGDWGGGTGIGEAALWHAARHSDRRGPATTLTAAIPGVYGLESLDAVIHAFHLKSLDYGDLARLSPVVFDQADSGDEIAGELVDRQGDEIALMAASCIERLELLDQEVPVVLGGGVLATRHPRLMAAVTRRLRDAAPLAVPIHAAAAPILGAALLALETAGASADALERATAALSPDAV
jgi:N-acetylglucosamine kinase-like BadF-type ATPase